MRTTLAAVLTTLVWLTPLSALAQAPAPPPGQSVEADPVRCWWRTDKAAIRMGEPFTAVLTCAVLETSSSRAIVDRSRLDHTVMALPPFDVLDGGTAEDVVTGARRFFQYTYGLRLLNDNAFGQDISLAGLSIGYRMDTATANGTTSQGRDQTYVMPPLTVRVLSLVAGSARDIRDTTSMTFASLDERRFRARAFGMAGWFFYALAAAVAAFAMARLYGAMRAPATAVASTAIPGSTVLKAAVRELNAVTREKSSQGWTDGLAARAGAALRVIASYAIGRPAAQTRGLAAAARSGQFALSQGLIRRRHALVSAAVTPQDLALPAASDGRLEQVREGLLAITAARFGRAALDEGTVDVAIAAAGPMARSLTLQYSWPMVQWRKVTNFVSGWKGRA